jgi:TRAP-type C4-dicarboxylate transport system permease small subunit
MIRIISMLCIVLIIITGTLSIWASALIIGLWSLTTPFSFIYFIMPIIMFTSIFFFIRAVVKLLNKEYNGVS